MTYDEWLSAVSNLLVIDPTNAEFLDYAPRAIEYAEQRMYRELDLLATYVASDAGPLTVGSRNFTLPDGTIVTNTINVITPAATAPDSGARNPLVPVSREYLDAVYGSSSTGLRGLPVCFAMLTNDTIAVGPWPDAAYRLEVSRTFRPEALSDSNQETVLTTYLPDAFLSCSMISWSLYIRDAGSVGSDEPARATNWESTYTAQMGSAQIENFRMRFAATSWSSKIPSPAANPQRG